MNRKASSGSSMVTSHLDLDNLTDPEEADGLHHDRADEHHLPHRLAEEQLHLFRVDVRERRGKTRRQCEKHVAGEAAVRCMDADLASDLESLANDAAKVLENLREVATALALNGDGCHEELDIEQRNASCEAI